jgi:hypothetical protein
VEVKSDTGKWSDMFQRVAERSDPSVSDLTTRNQSSKYVSYYIYLLMEVKDQVSKWSEMSKRVADRSQSCISDKTAPTNQ